MSLAKLREHFPLGGWILFAVVFYAGGYLAFDSFANRCARQVEAQDFVTALGTCRKAQAFGLIYQFVSPEKYRTVINELSLAELQNQKYDSAREHLHQNLARYEQASDKSLRGRGVVLVQMGLLSAAEGKLEEQQKWFVRAVEVFEELELPCDPAAVQAGANLGGSLLAAGKPAEAERVLRARVAANSKCGDVPSSNRGSTLRILADAQAANGNLAEAASTLDQAIELIQAGRGLENVEMAYALISRATALAGLKRYDESRHDAQSAIKMLERSSGPQAPEIGTALSVLGSVSLAKRDFKRALDEYGEAEKIYVGQFGLYHPWVASALTQKAAALRALGREDEARRALRSVEQINAELAAGDRPG